MHYHRSINGAVDQRWSLQWSALHQMSNFRFLRKRWLNADNRWSALILKTVILHRFFHKKTLLFQSTLINDENGSCDSLSCLRTFNIVMSIETRWSNLINDYLRLSNNIIADKILSSLIKFYNRWSNIIIVDQILSSLIKFYNRWLIMIIVDFLHFIKIPISNVILLCCAMRSPVNWLFCHSFILILSHNQNPNPSPKEKVAWRCGPFSHSIKYHCGTAAAARGASRAGARQRLAKKKMSRRMSQTLTLNLTRILTRPCLGSPGSRLWSEENPRLWSELSNLLSARSFLSHSIKDAARGVQLQPCLGTLARRCLARCRSGRAAAPRAKQRQAREL